MKKITENTLENKAKFFAQYWGLWVFCFDETDIEHPFIVEKDCLSSIKYSFLQLTPLSQITDEDAIEVAKLAHERYESNWKVIRNDDGTILHVECEDSYNIKYHISMMFDYATVNANMYIPNDKTGKFDSFKVNIGEVRNSSNNPIGYIAIVDYLRSKEYAVPSMGLSVKKLIEYNWVKTKKNEKIYC